jgi:flagellar motility protein MotE (MotC chaperone)
MKFTPFNVIIASFCVIALYKSGELAFDVLTLEVNAQSTTQQETTDNTDNKEIPAKEIDVVEKNKKTVDAKKKIVKGVEEPCLRGVMLDDMIEKRKQLEKTEIAIKEKTKLLSIAEKRIEEQLAKLTALKQELVEKAKLADAKVKSDGVQVLSIYEKMKPKKAAIIFNEMSPNAAAELLRNMRNDNSAQILANMDPKKAYYVTLALSNKINSDNKKASEFIKE